MFEGRGEEGGVLQVCEVKKVGCLRVLGCVRCGVFRVYVCVK